MSKFTDLLRRFLGVDGGPRRSVASPSPGGGAPHQGSEKAASVSLRAALAATHQSTPNTELTPLTYMPRAVDPFAPVAPLPAQIEAGASEMAFDSAMFPSIADAYFNEGIGFFGYQTLAQLSQRAEYRKMIEILALDMTREWIRFTYTGDGEGDSDAQDKITAIDKRFRELQVQDKFRQVAEMDGLFGRGHIHINLGDANDPAELKSRLVVDPRKIKKGGLKRLTVVDPTWTYPGVYNSTDPLAPYFYVPETWYVMNKEVHESRLLTFVSRPLPDILKAAYAFGGVSLTQMAKPYVDNWLQMRQSVADLVQAFSVFILKTDMSAVMNGTDATSLQLRAELFNLMRKNNGLMMLNKSEAQGDPGEDLTNIAVPLAGLNELLSSAQEQMSFVSGLPLVKLLGVTPSGLNASSDGEVRVYYDTVAAQQEAIFRAPLETILQIVQLDQFGEIDEDIGIEFMPLWQMDEAQQATARKADAETDIAYVNAGVLAPEEVREKLAADKASFWTNLDTSDVPETPEEQRDLAEGEKDLAEADRAEAEAGQPKPIEAAPIPQAKDERIRDRYKLHNFDIVIETPRGKKRQGTDHAGKPWECTMAADYGYIDGTWSTEGRSEGMDCFIGPDPDSQKVFVIDQGDLQTGQFDEHKCMIGFGSQKAAVRAYLDSYDSRGVERIMDVTEITVNALRHWLENGDLYRPISPEAYDVTRPATGAMDAEFAEGKHPRAENGQFGSGGGGESGKASEAGSEGGAEKTAGAGQAAGSTGAAAAATSGSREEGSKESAQQVESEHFIPAHKFEASSYASQHDDPNASAESVLANFPSDTAQKIRDAQAKLATKKQTSLAHKKDGNYDPQRAELHRKIIVEGVTKKVMDEKTGEMVERHFPGILSADRVAAATPKDGKPPTFTILGGRGGSGKSWFKDKVYDEGKAIVLDSDHIKQLLPEYEGWNAAEVHEESGEIFDKITDMAREMGLNIVHDSTMKTPEKAVRLVKDFKDRGYRAEAHYMHLPRQEAAKRAVDRFLGKTQRLVPPEVVLENTNNEKSFDAVKSLADKWSFRDNNVPRGHEPKLISESGS